MKSFIAYNSDSDFSIHNIPFGVAVIDNEYPSCVTRIGDTVIDLAELFEAGLFDEFEIEENIFEAPVLNHFIQLGKEITVPFREKIQSLLLKGSELENDTELQAMAFHDINSVDMLLPVHVPNYTDFYSSIEHATNVGKMFRDPENALLPNWKHLPVGYHGRASSIVGTNLSLHRPKGQTKPNDVDAPVFGPTKRLDFELEIAFITNSFSNLGESISTDEAENNIFGMVIFNDWSARDMQKWEYVPLGPFLAKNFGSSVSPWIVTLEALEPFRVAGPTQEPEVLPYLQYHGKKNIDINLQVALTPQDSQEEIICNSNYKYMYWNMAQQLAHHTVNGCNIEVGDMYASGTISGKDQDSYGSMLEITWGGQKPLQLQNGQERKFIEDYDTVTMRGWSEKDGIRVGFGEVKTQILPTK